jgi:hypothetical protein
MKIRKIITYQECIKILKNLEVFPSLISNYDLKLILFTSEEEAPKEFKFKTQFLRKKHKTWGKEIENIGITFKMFLRVFSNYLSELVVLVVGNKGIWVFSHMLSGGKKHYSVTFWTETMRQLQHRRGIQQIHLDEQGDETKENKMQKEMVVKHKYGMNYGWSGVSTSKMRLNRSSTLENLTTYANNENSKEIQGPSFKQDFSKEIIIKAGSIRLDSKSRSRSKNKSSISTSNHHKLRLNKTSDVFKSQHILPHTPNFLAKQITGSLLDTPKSSNSSVQLSFTKHTIKNPRRERSLRNLLSSGLPLHINKSCISKEEKLQNFFNAKYYFSKDKIGSHKINGELEENEQRTELIEPYLESWDNRGRSHKR